MSSEPNRALQAALPVVGAALGAFLFYSILPVVDLTGAPVLFVALGLLLPAGLAYLFHPSLYVGARRFRSRRVITPAVLAALGAGLGLASGGPLGYLFLPPLWAIIGSFQLFRSPKRAV